MYVAMGVALGAPVGVLLWLIFDQAAFIALGPSIGVMVGAGLMAAAEEDDEDEGGEAS